MLPERLDVGLPLSDGETVGEVETEPLDDGDGDEDALNVCVPDALSVPDNEGLVEPEPEGVGDKETVAEALVERVGAADAEPEIDAVAEGVGAVESEANEEGDAVAESEGAVQPEEAATKVVPAGQGAQAVVAPARLKVKGGHGAHATAPLGGDEDQLPSAALRTRATGEPKKPAAQL